MVDWKRSVVQPSKLSECWVHSLCCVPIHVLFYVFDDALLYIMSFPDFNFTVNLNLITLQV